MKALRTEFITGNISNRSRHFSFSALLRYETGEWQIHELPLFLTWNREEKVDTEKFWYKKDVNIDESNVFEAGILP